MKIESRLEPIELNGEETKGIPSPKDSVIVSAHWNSNRLVVIEFHGLNFTVVARELEKAIANATNHD
jgi:hypothetical protein